MDDGGSTRSAYATSFRTTCLATKARYAQRVPIKRYFVGSLTLWSGAAIVISVRISSLEKRPWKAMPPVSAMASVASFEPQKGDPRKGNEIERQRSSLPFASS